MRHSIRTRLTTIYGGLFLLAGIALLVINFVLVRATLPKPRIVATNETATGKGKPSEAVTFQRAVPSSANDTLILSLQQYRDSTLDTLLLQSGIAVIIMAVVAVGLGWLVANRALRGVHTITVMARDLGAQNLDKRIALQGPRDELKELADTFDGMLDRLSAAFDSQRRFVANASHELRTPLAMQRTLIEVALANPDTGPRMHKLGTQLLDANERNERLIKGLLLLARSDRGLVRHADVRLDEIVRSVLDNNTAVAAEHDVTMRSALAECHITGEATLLEQLVHNLVSNAIRYNVPGGSVNVRLSTSDGDATLIVRNTGNELAVEDISALFEPFRRLGAERTDASGTGLGLSIVRSVATAHNGSVDAHPEPRGGLRVTVALPAATPAARSISPKGNDRRSEVDENPATGERCP